MSWNDNVSKLTPKSQTGKFTFHDASTLTASLIMVGTSGLNGGSVDWSIIQNFNFTKQ